VTNNPGKKYSEPVKVALKTETCLKPFLVSALLTSWFTWEKNEMTRKINSETHTEENQTGILHVSNVKNTQFTSYADSQVMLIL
jgi:hypothetical protein